MIVTSVGPVFHLCGHTMDARLAPNEVSAIACAVSMLWGPWHSRCRNYFPPLLQHVHASLAIHIDMVWLARPCAGSAMGVIGRAIASRVKHDVRALKIWPPT